MKISILLPFKENFSPSYAGAVSLFINDTLRSSKFRKNITVFGHTNYKKKFRQKYSNIDIKFNRIKVRKLIKLLFFLDSSFFLSNCYGTYIKMTIEITQIIRI